MLRFLTAGESHGKALVAILEGMPAGLKIDTAKINAELKKRQAGYGRGERMDIESDEAEVLSGVRRGETIGSPIAVLIANKDAAIDLLPAVHSPRPGHADLAGAVKYDRADMRDILERASARETAARVAVGSICKILIAEFGVETVSHVVRIGGVKAHTAALSVRQVADTVRGSPVRCADEAASKLMCELIDRAKADGDSLGGVFEVIVVGHPAGLGSHVQWDRRLDTRLAAAVMSIPAVKGVEIGRGFQASEWMGSEVHDPIAYKDGVLTRKSNNAGGLEGGITNGEPILIRGAMKPISTLAKPLDSVDMRTKKPAKAVVERADVCAVPSAAVIAENVCAVVMADAILEKFGGDSLKDIRAAYNNYLERLARL